MKVLNNIKMLVFSYIKCDVAKPCLGEQEKNLVIIVKVRIYYGNAFQTKIIRF